MLRSGMDLPPECRECFGVSEVVAKMATLQDEFATLAKDSYYKTDNSGRHVIYTGRVSEVRRSEADRLYTEAENQVLDILELATFCRGEECFKDTVAR